MDEENKRLLQNQKILIFENTHTLTNHLLDQWLIIARESVQRNNRFTVAVCGGHSPVEFFCKLSALDDFSYWQRTHIFFTDERFVPVEDNNSNFAVVKNNLLNYVSIPPENVHPIDTSLKNIEVAAEAYKNELVRFFEFKESGLPQFDLVLLGLGTDGHIASLFPDDKRIDEVGRLVLPVSLPHLKYERVSLTLPVINNARNIIALVIGAAKSNIFGEIVEKNLSVPGARISPVNGQTVYLVDKDGAQKLSYRDSFSHEGEAVFYEFGRS